MDTGSGIWPAQAEQKDLFLVELVYMCNYENLPVLMGGDYNILRHPLEKIMTNTMLDGHFYIMLAYMV
jgi:hypothetical protein